MYEKFTDRSRKVFQHATQEAHRLNHEYLGTEHLLVGIMQEVHGVAACVLKNLGVSMEGVREAINTLAGPPQPPTLGKLPYTPRVRSIIDWAKKEAEQLGHNYVGTEHLLLGMTREEGWAMDYLKGHGVLREKIREEVLALLGGGNAIARTPPEFAQWVQDHARQIREANDRLDQAEETHTLECSSAIATLATRVLLWERNRVLAILRAELDATSTAMPDGSRQVTAEGAINSLIAKVEAKEKEG